MNEYGTKLDGVKMILPDFILPSRVNQRWEYSGIDSPDLASNKQHFKNFQHNVNYYYNSRGYRDDEWPDDLTTAIWCIGDSFTVGLGSPLSHTWPKLLQTKANKRTINVSMDGGSNTWMLRKSMDILTIIKPETLIIHWSFLHRREADYYSVLNNSWFNFYNNIKDPSWPDCPEFSQRSSLPTYILKEIDEHDQQFLHPSDEDLKNHHGNKYSSYIDDVELTIDCINTVEKNKIDCNVIHSFIPFFCPRSCIELFYSKLPTTSKIVPDFQKIDLARDGFHYDIKTSLYFVDKIMPLL